MLIDLDLLLSVLGIAIMLPFVFPLVFPGDDEWTYKKTPPKERP